jgi:hypothetical protein
MSRKRERDEILLRAGSSVLPPRARHLVRIGGYSLLEMPDETLFLQNAIGEGMHLKAKHLEPVIRKFFDENF